MYQRVHENRGTSCIYFVRCSDTRFVFFLGLHQKIPQNNDTNTQVQRKISTVNKLLGDHFFSFTFGSENILYFSFFSSRYESENISTFTSRSDMNQSDERCVFRYSYTNDNLKRRKRMCTCYLIEYENRLVQWSAEISQNFDEV